MKSFKNICHILKEYLKDSENLPTQKFTNFQYQKILLCVQDKSLRLFLNLILFSLVFFYLVIGLCLPKLRDIMLLLCHKPSIACIFSSSFFCTVNPTAYPVKDFMASFLPHLESKDVAKVMVPFI